MYPEDLKYTDEHEWVRPGEASVRAGITAYAQEALGDIVYVSLPEVGEAVEAGAAIGELESTKSVSDLFSPLSGRITAVNNALDDEPELCNSDPYGAGWIFEIEPSDPAAVEALMTAATYQDKVASE